MPDVRTVIGPKQRNELHPNPDFLDTEAQLTVNTAVRKRYRPRYCDCERNDAENTVISRDRRGIGYVVSLCVPVYLSSIPIAQQDGHGCTTDLAVGIRR